MPAIESYKCPCCGGAIEFNTDSQNLKCPYCDTEFDIDTVKEYNEGAKAADQKDDIQWEVQGGTEWKEGETDGLKVYECGSCGAQIITPETTGASKCPYCGNPVIMKGTFDGDLRPDTVIPFKHDKKAAMEAYRSHLKGKKLLPKTFQDENHIEEIQGIYVPFWLFDAKADADVRFKASKSAVRMRGQQQVMETSYYSLLRSGTATFENVPVDGSEKMDNDLMESIEPFDYSEAKPFNTAYLAGFLADKFDVDSADSVSRANERIKTSTVQRFVGTVSGYDAVQVENSSVRVSNGKAKYSLYPVWLLNTQWNDQTFTFAMNGQTGKMVGDLPADEGAYRTQIIKYSLIGMVLTWAVCWLLYFFTMAFNPLSLTAILISVVIGLVIGFTAGSSARSELKSVSKNQTANSYIKEGGVTLTGQSDHFLYRNVSSSGTVGTVGGPTGVQGGTRPGTVLLTGRPGMQGGRPQGGPGGRGGMSGHTNLGRPGGRGGRSGGPGGPGRRH